MVYVDGSTSLWREWTTQNSECDALPLQRIWVMLVNAGDCIGYNSQAYKREGNVETCMYGDGIFWQAAKSEVPNGIWVFIKSHSLPLEAPCIFGRNATKNRPLPNERVRMYFLYNMRTPPPPAYSGPTTRIRHEGLAWFSVPPPRQGYGTAEVVSFLLDIC